jgi:LysM repeat protein
MAPSEKDAVYEVQYGQSLWSIAVTYGTTIEQIPKLSNQDNYSRA